MEFSYDEVDRDVLVIRADGGLNADTAGEFVKQLEALVDAGLRRIIIDCEHLDYVSSYGMTVLLRVHSKLKAHGGDVKLAAVRTVVAAALAVVRFDEYFSLYPDVNRARLAFRAPSPDDSARTW